MIISFLIGLAVLSVLILVHELGHFAAAKAFRIRVDEFGLGFPPRLLSFKLGETRYSLNAIPFGGFTKMAGEEDPEVPRSLASRGVGTRLTVLSAGSLMNILLPLLLLSIAFMVPHYILTGQVVVAEVISDSPAEAAGIEAGDSIISINGKPVRNGNDLHRYIQLNLGRETSLLVEHSNSTTEEVQLIPRWKPPEGQGAIGIAATMLNPTITRQSEPFWRAVPMGVTEFAETFILYKNGIIGIIIGAVPATIIGPVGIVQVTGEVAQAGISPLLEFAALISLILGVVNLFPLPALDGGRIAFVLLEWVRRGKRVPPRVEGLVHLTGFILLIAVLLVVTYQDIVRIVSGEGLLP
ncbi:MAG: PDZ domain-containing protein [Dehalococcoidia bacterium]|nr:MAG: PDZ domain-containing protein [Dehalococcoidia bacterium]